VSILALRIRTTSSLLALLLCSCGSDATPSTPIGASDYCETIEPFFCAFYVRCGRMDIESAAACKAPFLASCNAVFEPRYIDLEAAGLLGLDADGIEQCKDHLETVACDQQIQELSGPCANMWRGTQAVGGSCGLDVESFVCAPDSACVLGLDFCGDCRPLVEVGNACVPGTDTCGDDAFCDGNICQARKRNGDACGSGDRCLTGSACTNAVCTPPSFVGNGETCDARHRCPYLTACIAGTCQPTGSTGDTCTSDGTCELGYCNANGLCEAPGANGAACDRASQCSSGLCDGTTCQARPSACIGA
jgi:hypothetical protein